MAAMIFVWMDTLARTFMTDHSSMVFGSFGHFGSSLTANVTSRTSQGNPGHTFVTMARLAMTGLLWGMALFGGLRRLRKGYHDGSYLLLAVVSFPLIVVQDYGGEMFLRIYLFVLPMMAFFTAILFFTTHSLGIRGLSIWRTLATCITCIVLIAGFLVTRYGNEHMDYITYDEFKGYQYLYKIAPAGSLLLEAWGDGPSQSQDYELYDYASLSDNGTQIIEKDDVDGLIQYIHNERPGHPAFIIFSRSQRVSAESFGGEPTGTMDRFEAALLKSNQFRLVYNHPDVQVLQFVGDNE
jgi:hypothetical protein